MTYMEIVLDPTGDGRWKRIVKVYSPDINPGIIIQDTRKEDVVLISYGELCRIKDKIDKDWFDGKPPEIGLT